MKILSLCLLLISAGVFYARDIVINAVGDTMMGTLYPEKHLPPENGNINVLKRN